MNHKWVVDLTLPGFTRRAEYGTALEHDLAQGPDPLFLKRQSLRLEQDRCFLAKLLGAYNSIPAIEAVEVLIGEPAKAIVAFGVNDVAYLNEKTARQINLPAYQEAVTDMVDELHRRGVRVCIQTITPRLGVARTMGKYDRNMEVLRLQLNDWIHNAGMGIEGPHTST